MSSSNHPLPPIPPDPASPTGGTVRRHHTITATSRTARGQAKDIISEETTSEQALWNDDELVDQDWVGGVGAVGEKTSLHRQSSLPTRYHRGFHGSTSANITPKAVVNSLAAIAGHEGDEEPWNIAEYDVQDDEQPVSEEQLLDAQAANAASPLSPHFNQPTPHVPSPPPAGSGVRRHVSLTYGAAVGGPRKMNAGLKRAGTLQATVPTHSQATTTPDAVEYPQEEGEYTYEAEDPNAPSAYNAEEEYYLRQQSQQQQQQYGSGGIGRSSPWSQGNEWRAPGNITGFNNTTTTTVDDVQRALSTLEIASSASTGAGYSGGVGTYLGGQSVHPPRFGSTPSRGSNNGNGGNVIGGTNGNKGPAEYEGRKTPSRGQNTSNWQQQQQRGDWDQGSQQQQNVLLNRRSNSNLQYGYQQGQGKGANAGAGAVPAVPMLPQQYLQQTQEVQQQQQSGRPGLGVTTNIASGNGTGIGGANSGQVQPFVSTPIDVPSLITSKGYNPANFDTRPQFARYFVIKSYTEDDVHKSLKYEIWSSTDPGNKRLDKAFKETAGRGPIYLFFSVNASGHFCGMAEMLTPVDYTRSSTVWASDKWKGVFKVRWIFVRDIPNASLRHIKLNNTQERKPVTNSRDTQELLPDAGQEMLRIFHTHPARTSLLQDFAFYELQAMQKMQAQGPVGNAPPTVPTIPNIPVSGLKSGASSPPNQPSSVVQSPQLSHASVSSASSASSHSNNNSMSSSPSVGGGYQNPYGMTPMMQMQMQMGMGMGGVGGMGITAPMNGMGMGLGLGGMGGMGLGGMGMGNMNPNAFGVHSQTHQAVMRHSSPAPPQGQHGQGQGQNQGQGYPY